MSEESKLLELIGEYFDLGYAEGVSGRDTDTMAGDAQRVLSEIQAEIVGIQDERDRLKGWWEVEQEKLIDSQARLFEAVKVLEEMRGCMSDMKGIIDKRHESGEMVDGGDLRYWSSLIEFALSKATIGEET